MIREFTNASLRERNSFGIDRRAARLVEYEHTDDLRELFANGGPDTWYVLGGGNNILFTDDYAGALLHPVGRGIRVVARDAERVEVEAEAGVDWDTLVAWAVEEGLWGIENLSQIPGTAGAAPVQNIGAYGCEVRQTIRSVEMFCPDTRGTVVLSGEHCGFGYRDSVFKHILRGRVIITSVRFSLSRKPTPVLGYGDLARETEARGGTTLRNIRDAVCAIRRSKLPNPAVTGNAGSFFRNPVVEHALAERLQSEYPDLPVYPAGDAPGMVKLAAGWLIERAGMKGRRAGAVGVHDRQALVLVNLGGATGADVLALARDVQRAVRERFGVEIDTEVNIL